LGHVTAGGRPGDETVDCNNLKAENNSEKGGSK